MLTVDDFINLKVGCIIYFVHRDFEIIPLIFKGTVYSVFIGDEEFQDKHYNNYFYPRELVFNFEGSSDHKFISIDETQTLKPPKDILFLTEKEAKEYVEKYS
mgnify:CR=1